MEQAVTRSRFGPLTDPGIAWIVLCLALAIHVGDEAANDFLSFYNPAVAGLRERLPFLPLPLFESESWLKGLAAVLLVLLALSPFAISRSSWMRPLSILFSAFMILNSMGHMVGSLYVGQIVPGTYSAPVLLTAAVLLLIAATRHWKRA